MHFSTKVKSNWILWFILNYKFNLTFIKDNDGRITSAELAEVLRSAGANPTEEQIREMVNEADSNKNGVVEFDEFVSMITRLQATLAR